MHSSQILQIANVYEQVHNSHQLLGCSNKGSRESRKIPAERYSVIILNKYEQ
jgi:hypothetical protein